MNYSNNSYNTYPNEPVQLPPLPPVGVTGEVACSTISLYLAVWKDLPPDQQRLVSAHVRSCPQCSREQRVLSSVTNLVNYLPSSEPSARVDQAVREAIAARTARVSAQRTAKRGALVSVLPPSAIRRVSRRSSSKWVPLLATAAVLVLALLTSAYFVFGHGTTGQSATVQQQAKLELPANLSWSNSILYQTQTGTRANGEHYEVKGYHDLGAGASNVEQSIPGKVDIVVLKDGQKGLSLDMKHRVAQWHPEDGQDEIGAMFDLARLRSDLQSGKASYLGKDHFNNQEVYRIRMADGHILLLDMHYQPVNVLENTGGKVNPMFDSLSWLPPSQVASSVWDMKIPKNFREGTSPMDL